MVAVPGDNEEDEEGNDGENVAEADEDESDLDLAWKMLDVARAIAEKHWGDSMEKVDILSALAEVALERGLFLYITCRTRLVCKSLLQKKNNTKILLCIMQRTLKRLLVTTRKH